MPGDDPDVARVVEEGLTAMREAGASLIDVGIPRLSDLLHQTFMYLRQSRRDINHSLTRSGTPFTDIAEIVATGELRPTDALLRAVSKSLEDPHRDRHLIALATDLERITPARTSPTLTAGLGSTA
ncbi:hypothetical protein ACFUTY_07365 [Streptomyces sp. NPDC057362]|uniref:hypothetical protein n=1 Tax=Streptomyces sp. NPDC057362 TaxID=3346106 RepID=UPI00363A4AE5